MRSRVSSPREIRSFLPPTVPETHSVVSGSITLTDKGEGMGNATCYSVDMVPDDFRMTLEKRSGSPVILTGNPQWAYASDSGNCSSEWRSRYSVTSMHTVCLDLERYGKGISLEMHYRKTLSEWTASR